jgi:hypothetical protein
MEWLSLPNDLLEPLWQGIMEGDGDHRGRLSGRRISTASGTLARQIVDLARRLGHSASLHSEGKRSAFRVMVNERDDREPYARKTLTTDYAGSVFNLEVEEDHSYVVEGYSVHNCWKLGEAFVKVSGDEEAFYAQVYLQRKAYEVERNARGDNAAKAAEILAAKRIGHDTDAHAWLTGEWVRNPKMNPPLQGLEAVMPVATLVPRPMLPPAQIHARAKRYAVKLFLAHLHEVMHEKLLGRPAPLPYPIAHLGHVHKVARP